jgi:bifunctional non-homologous end joining protein LigD
MARRKALPAFIAPMLAKPGQAFDSDEHLFEIKWDGTRTLCFVEDGCYRLVNRRGVDLTERYPEFSFLRDFPPGTVLDGEMVLFKDGKPDFALLMSREQARAPLKIRTLARSMPAVYVVFDILTDRGRSVMDRPLRLRRRLLEKRLAQRQGPRLMLSQCVVGPGRAFFDETVKRGLEGIVAKGLASKYDPGRRTGAWIKVKRRLELYCMVIGFLPSGKDDFKSLIVAAEEDGGLRPCGKVGTGFDTALRRRINRWLWTHLRKKPVIPCTEKGKWVEPGLVCRVSCMERSARGELRAPVFEGLVKE